MINKLKWYSTKNGVDSTWNSLPADDFMDYRQYIMDNTSFMQILKYFKIRADDCLTGKYSHRMVCPFKFHKNGRERTGSFRFNNKKKTFTCFGCTEGGDILKFLQLYRGGSDEFNLRRIAVISGLIKDGELQIPDNYVESDIPIKENNQKILFEAGLLLRQYLLEITKDNAYAKECEWSDQMLIKIDRYFDMIDEDNIEDAQKIYNNLNNSIKRRRDKRGI